MLAAPRFRLFHVASSTPSSRPTTCALLLLAAALSACGGTEGSNESRGAAASMDASSPDASSRSRVGEPTQAAAPSAPPPPAAEYNATKSLGDRGDGGRSLGMIGAASPQPVVQSQQLSQQPASAAVRAPSLPPTVPSASAVPAMVIRSGQASVQVDSLARAIASIQRITASLGGYVGNTAIALGEDQVRRATVELKIPVGRYDDAVAGLSPLGKVESVNSTAEDVGEEFTDLTARITNAHKLEARLIGLLAERTGKLQDALMVERELARVREEIERYEGRIRFLGARVAMSTLTVNLHEAVPLVSQNPSENVLVEAAKDAWRNFVSLLALAIASLGVVLPVAVLGVGAYAVYRRRVVPHPASARGTAARGTPDVTR